MSEKIIKSLDTEILDIAPEKGIIKGYANVYNLKDKHGDISAPGSFIKTVSEQKGWIRINKNHDRSLLIGDPTELDAHDPYGLRMTAKMNMDTQLGRDSYNEFAFLIENGSKVGISIGGHIAKRDDKNRSIVKEYRLSEISLLTVEPSNDQSFVETYKSLQESIENIDSFFAIVEKAYNAQGFSDPYKQSLENILKSLTNVEPEQDIATTQIVEPAENQIIKFYSQFITK